MKKNITIVLSNKQIAALKDPITRKEFQRLVNHVNKQLGVAERIPLHQTAKAALRLASHHDPDLEMRIETLERQMIRIGAPQYRRVK